MTNENFETTLRSFDYSLLSGVRDSLLTDLLQKRQADRAENMKSRMSTLFRTRNLSMDELDDVIAAGRPIRDEKNQKK